MRHTCVTLVLSLGVHPRVVMEIVGHSAMDMTMNVYAHVSLDVPRQALDVLNAELDREPRGVIPLLSSPAVTDTTKARRPGSTGLCPGVELRGLEPLTLTLPV
jgi:hypothetical protein